MDPRRAALGTLTEALARRGDERAGVTRLGIALHGDAPAAREGDADALHVAALAHVGVEPHRDATTPIAEASEPEREQTTVYLAEAARVRACSTRLGDRIAVAHQALASVRTLASDPTTSRSALAGAVSELARTLAQARRSLRAVAAELAAVEADSRVAVVAAFDARTRGRLG